MPANFFETFKTSKVDKIDKKYSDLVQILAYFHRCFICFDLILFYM